jgi:hypothetical protein
VSEQIPAVSPLPNYAVPGAAPSTPTAGAAGCVNCGEQSFLAAGAPMPAADWGDSGFVYGVGRLHARFSSLGAQKEYTQITGSDPDAVVRTAALKDVLAEAENRYLAWQICWVLSGPGSDACLVVARDGRDLDELIETLTDDGTIQVVVGSPAAAGSAAVGCLATGVPAVWPDQLLSFRRDEFLDALPEPGEGGGKLGAKDAEAWRQTAGGLFDYLTQRSENRGISDPHRAMNFVALRYPPIYHLAFDAQRQDKSLIGVDARPSGAGSGRRAVDVRFAFRSATTHVVERYLCQIDVTDLFPFLTRSLTLTYD